MLPRIAVIGEFQVGKSLVLNSILGSPALPVGESGFRTTPCPVYCEHAPLDRVEFSFEEHQPVRSSSDLLHSRDLQAELPALPRTARLLLNRPLLSEFTLIDTPGLDYSDSDDSQALDAVASADSVLVVTTQQLAAGKPGFEMLVKILRLKPWALILNCGRSGPHLQNSSSSAAKQVLGACLKLLEVEDVSDPVFSHSLSVRAMSRLIGNRESRQSQCDPNDPIAREALGRDERSVEELREKLLTLASASRDHVLKRFLKLIESQLHDSGIVIESFEWSQSPVRFHAKVKGDWNSLLVSGGYQLERIGLGYQLQLTPDEASESWVLDRIKEVLPPLQWKLEYPELTNGSGKV